MIYKGFYIAYQEIIRERKMIKKYYIRRVSWICRSSLRWFNTIENAKKFIDEYLVNNLPKIEGL